MSCVVYWLYDEQCVCMWKHGYIGVSTNFRSRLKQHRAERRGFKHCVVFEGSSQECYALEAVLRPTAFVGWNAAPGGEGGPSQPRSLEHRQKIREAALRRYANPDERKKMSELQKGRKFTPEWCANIAAGKQGTKASDATRAKMSAIRKGRRRAPFTLEHRANIAAAMRGMKMPWIAESNRRRKKGGD
jgi:hypothetical protein